MPQIAGDVVLGWAGRMMALACVATPALLVACGSGRPLTTGAPDPGAATYRVILPVPAIPLHRPVVPAPQTLTTVIDTLGRQFQGRVGIAVKSVDEGWIVSSNGMARMPQQSVSKLWVSMTVLDFLDSGRLRLTDPVTVRREDLTLFHQPIASLVKGDGYQATVGELLRRALTQSDNTANDRLLTFVGGPTAVRGFIERKELGDIRFGPGERLLQSRTAGLTWRPEYSLGNSFEIARSRLPMDVRVAALDAYVANPPDGATAAAIATALARLARGDLLSAASTQYLLGTMGQSITGRARLRAVVPAGWSIAHKTGTGQELGSRAAGLNDVGLLTAPDGRRYAVAVLIGDTTRPMRERQQLIQAVGRAVVEYQSGQSPASVVAAD